MTHKTQQSPITARPSSASASPQYEPLATSINSPCDPSFYNADQDSIHLHGEMSEAELAKAAACWNRRLDQEEFRATPTIPRVFTRSYRSTPTTRAPSFPWIARESPPSPYSASEVWLQLCSVAFLLFCFWVVVKVYSPRSLRGPVRLVECMGCVEKLDEDVLPDVPLACRGRHKARACRSCWQQWLDTQVSTVRSDQIACIQCGERLEQADIRSLATAEVFERYLQNELRNIMSADTAFTWCLSPTCNSGQIHDGGDIFTCSACGFRQCVHCNVAWHPGVTCEDFQELHRAEQKAKTDVQEIIARNEASSKRVLDKESKICPGKKCGRRVQKISGCDHMTCSMCKHEFCWQCLASHQKIRDEGNTAHQKHCPYHSDNLNAPWYPR